MRTVTILMMSRCETLPIRPLWACSCTSGGRALHVPDAAPRAAATPQDCHRLAGPSLPCLHHVSDVSREKAVLPIEIFKSSAGKPQPRLALLWANIRRNASRTLVRQMAAGVRHSCSRPMRFHVKCLMHGWKEGDDDSGMWDAKR